MRGAACKQGNNEVFLHMSNHYRRLYNAKCAVDTSPPRNFRRQRTSSTDFSTCNLNFADIIGNDTKQSPNSYAIGKRQQEENRPMCRPTAKNYCRRTPNKVPPKDIIDRHAENFATANRQFKPRILKTDAQSKVRSLRVYHPPTRRKRPCETRNYEGKKWEEEVASVQLSNLCAAQKIASSKESSRDSAYNGGISSGADTPEQPSPVSGVCRIDPCNDPTSCEVENSPTKCQPEESSPTCRNNASQSSLQTMVVKCHQRTKPPLQKVLMKDDAAYVQFVYDITEDVLARGIYSDRGLRQLFERHVEDNKGHLDLGRMQEEIAKLSQQLGIQTEDICKGEMHECMRSFEELMDVIRSVQRVNTKETQCTVGVSSHANDSCMISETEGCSGLKSLKYNCKEADYKETDCKDSMASLVQNKEYKNVYAQTSPIWMIPNELECVNSKQEQTKAAGVGCQTSATSLVVLKNYGLQSNVDTGSEDDSQTQEHKIVVDDAEEKSKKHVNKVMIDIGIQTSKILMISQGVGSCTILVKEGELPNMLSEYVDTEDTTYDFPYSRHNVTQAAEEIVDKYDKYGILHTVGKRKEIIDSAAELVAYIMEQAVITYNIAEESSSRV